MEVVIALLVLEVGVLSALGTVIVAMEAQRRAERMEVATSVAESVLDSLRQGSDGTAGTRAHANVVVSWTVDTQGMVTLVSVDSLGTRLLELTTRVSIP